MPTIYGHCDTVYKAMLKGSKEEITEYEKLRVWEGFTTKLLINELGVPAPTYGKVIDILQRAGCITQLKRGGGTGKSKWALNFEPTEEIIGEHATTIAKESRGLPSAKLQLAQLRQEFTKLQKEIGGLDIRKVIGDMVLRLATLEEKVDGEVADLTDRVRMLELENEGLDSVVKEG